ncbi:tetratricopeptide repeat protein, partial [bacterium]|nr:tetratricopeptide repeat protein [bacterium]
RNPVLIYAFGFALSYYGEGSTEQLNQSNEYLSRALTEDYRMVYPYLTMSYNYELLERLEEERQKKKSGFFIRASRIVIAPIKWAYGLLPIGGDSKKERYYEKAINALITAVELNDETIDLNMEVLLVQNLANNFYHLGEFGYKKAYFNYQRRLSLDSTFTRVLEKAVFFERSGHCGTVLADEENAGRHLRIAIQTYEDLGREQDVLRNKRMFAFHFHLSGLYEDAIQIYEEILLQDEKMGLWNEVERGYRNIAYNYYLMGEPEDALKFARSAEKILDRQEIPVGPPKKSSLRIELLGFSIPVWGMEEIGGASAEGFTIAEEAALVYSLISRSLESIKS